MLICTDCGLPLDERESQALARQRLGSALTLMVMATVGGAMALLAAMNEIQAARPGQGAGEQKQEEQKEEGRENLLMAPSGLTESLERPSSDVSQPRDVRGAAGGATVSATQKAIAPSAENQPKR